MAASGQEPFLASEYCVDLGEMRSWNAQLEGLRWECLRPCRQGSTDVLVGSQ